jgi:hypothetical protein
MGRMGVSVQAFKELEKKYTENEHVLDNILNNSIRTVRISHSNTNQEDEDAGGCRALRYRQKSTEKVIWM